MFRPRSRTIGGCGSAFGPLGDLWFLIISENGTATLFECAVTGRISRFQRHIFPPRCGRPFQFDSGGGYHQRFYIHEDRVAGAGPERYGFTTSTSGLGL